MYFQRQDEVILALVSDEDVELEIETSRYSKRNYSIEYNRNRTALTEIKLSTKSTVVVENNLTS